MKPYYPPSGLRHGIDVLIDPAWSPDQAMAVVELLDDLRDRIWAHYEPVLQRKFSDERVTYHHVEVTDPPF
ncbi:MAG: hypothetical protein WCP34_15765 [Pseudomonadota bacterium]